MNETELHRGQFTFYDSYFKAISRMPKCRRLALYEALCAYALLGKEPETLSGPSEAIFSMIRPVLRTGRAKADQRMRELQDTEADGDPSTGSNKNKNKNKDKNKDKDKNKNKEKTKEKGAASEGGAEEGEEQSEFSIDLSDAEQAPFGRGEQGLLAAAGSDPALRERLETFVGMRRASGRPLTEASWDLLRQRLLDYPESERLRIVEQSLRSGWSDFYPLSRRSEPEQKQYACHGQPLSPMMAAAVRRNLAEMERKSPPDDADGLWG